MEEELSPERMEVLMPLELWLHVFTFLDWMDVLLSVMPVCRLWQELGSSDSIWKNYVSPCVETKSEGTVTSKMQEVLDRFHSRNSSARNSDLWDASALSHYYKQNCLGRGAYGCVWEAIEKRSYSGTEQNTERKKGGRIVAVKRVFDAFCNKNEALRAFKEVVVMMAFRKHPTISRILDVIVPDTLTPSPDMYIVMERMEVDLNATIKAKVLEEIHMQYITYQLLLAVEALHSANILHNDIKPDCGVRLADFGSATYAHEPYVPEEDISYEVRCRWYSAPESLMQTHGGGKSLILGKAADVWRVGCILAEMVLGRPLFCGVSHFDQLVKICDVIGYPTSSTQKLDEKLFRPESLENLISFHNNNYNNQTTTTTLKSLMPSWASTDCLDLIEKLLAFDPDGRLAASEALKHPFVAEFSEFFIGNDKCPRFALPPSLRPSDCSVQELKYQIKEMGKELKNKPTSNLKI